MKTPKNIIKDRKIIVTFIHPPIPDRRFDWRAHWDDEGEDGIHGMGRSSEEAVQDLLAVGGPECLSNTEILCFILGWQGGTIHQVAERLGVGTGDIIHAGYARMQELMRLAQRKADWAKSRDERDSLKAEVAELLDILKTASNTVQCASIIIEGPDKGQEHLWYRRYKVFLAKHVVEGGCCMTLYHAVAWCDRTFTAQYGVDADNPEAALAKAKEAVHDAPAEECDNGYPWDTFLINDEQGNRVAAEEPVDKVAAERDRLEVEITRLEKLVYVPGLWKCAKCQCTTVCTNLHVDTGGFSANNEPQKCPNHCGPMWRVTERDAGNQAIDRHITDRDRLHRIIRNFIGCALTCRRKNTAEWFRSFASDINTAADAIGDMDRAVVQDDHYIVVTHRPKGGAA